jgi:molybdopterin converting factor small subunit
MPLIRIPTPMRQYTEGESVVSVPEGSAGSVVVALTELWPSLRAKLLAEDGRLLPHALLFVNGENIRHNGGFDAPVCAHDEVSLVIAVAGG